MKHTNDDKLDITNNGALDTLKDAIDTVGDMADGGDAKTFLAGLLTGAGLTWAAITKGAKMADK
jgi:hypothetical protein